MQRKREPSRYVARNERDKESADASQPRSLPDDVRLRAGDKFIELLLSQQTVQEEPHPDDISNDSVSPQKFHRKILEHLARSQTAQTQVEIATAIDAERKTVGEKLRELELGGLVARPYGKRSGFTITSVGRQRLQSTDGSH